MKFGVALFGLYGFKADPTLYPAVAIKAEELGFESAWIGDHVVFPASFVREGGDREWHSLLTADMDRPDPFITLTYMAAVTKRLRFGQNVYLLPLRRPLVTARTVGTLDWLSGGRVNLCVGVGWLREEFEAMGEDFHNRGARTEEIVEVLKRLWTQDVAEFHGKYYDFGPVKFQPKPAQRPHPPIHFGGTSEVALRRSARLGDGWVGGDNVLAQVGEFVQKLRVLRREYGRENAPFEITQACSAVPTLDVVSRCKEGGADRIILSPWSPSGPKLSLDDVHRGMERFANEVMARLR